MPLITEAGAAMLRLLPPVTRARNFRLYLANGKRLVDLWQYGGAAILGHTGANVLRSLKNSAERGLFAPFPHFEEKRLLKALGCLFKDKCFRVFSNEKSCENALKQADYNKFPQDSWLPFSNFDESKAIFRAILPFPLAPAVFVLDKSLDKTINASDLVSAVLLAATSRSIYNLLSKPERGIMRFNEIKNTFNDETVGKSWEMQGIYIKPKFNIDDEKRAVIFKTFLAAGFLLPPESTSPIILPGELSKGEEEKLVSLLRLQF